MRWINRKEWAFVFVTIMLLMAGMIYFVLQPQTNEHFISEPDHQKTFKVLAGKIEKDSLVIRVDGLTSANYDLRLDVYRFNKKGENLQRSYSEIIKIPAGEIHAAFKRRFNGDSASAYLTYLPEKTKNIHGQIVLKTSFF